MRVHPLAQVLALDIDGTIGDYYGHFQWFAELYLQKEVRPVWRDGLKGDFSSALHIDKPTYRDIKLAYRQGGMKRCMPVLDDPTEEGRLKVEIELIRSYGIQVWIATTRPYLRLDNIDKDTQFWLARNCGRVDGLIYGEDKYADLIDIVGQERILGVIDDLPENIERARGLGLRTAIRAGDHNSWWRYGQRNWNSTELMGTITNLASIADGWLQDHKENKA